MPKFSHLLMAASLGLLLPFIATAENNKHRYNQAETSTIGAMPSRGMSMAIVKQYFGEPNRRHSPIGTPPIIRWQYADMMIYFEYEYVIHAVAK